MLAIMLRFSVFSLCVALALASTARASIVSWNCAGDGTGLSAQVTNWTWDNSDHTAATLDISGTQTTTQTGSMISNVGTDTAVDPTLNYINSVTNDTGPGWDGYYIQVKVDAPNPLTGLSISGGTVTTPTDWTTTTIQPTGGWNGSEYEYVGSLNLQAGSVVGAGDDLDFAYKLSFLGSTQYMVTQMQTPHLYQVPEPGTMALLAGIAGALLFWQRRVA